jgi:hypothetical protein
LLRFRFDQLRQFAMTFGGEPVGIPVSKFRKSADAVGQTANQDGRQRRLFTNLRIYV